MIIMPRSPSSRGSSSFGIMSSLCSPARCLRWARKDQREKLGSIRPVGVKAQLCPLTNCDLGKWLAHPEPQEASLHGTCTWGRWESHTDDTLKCPLSDRSCYHHSLEKLGCALPLSHKGLILSTLLPSKRQPVRTALTCLACTNSLFPGASPFPGIWFKQALSVGPT